MPGWSRTSRRCATGDFWKIICHSKAGGNIYIYICICRGKAGSYICQGKGGWELHTPRRSWKLCAMAKLEATSYLYIYIYTKAKLDTELAKAKLETWNESGCVGTTTPPTTVSMNCGPCAIEDKSGDEGPSHQRDIDAFGPLERNLNERGPSLKMFQYNIK